MGINEKITEVEKHKGLILYKEGIFYKLYNKHAMLYYVNYNEFKINVKFYKNINQLVYSIGFPVASFKQNVFGSKK